MSRNKQTLILILDTGALLAKYYRLVPNYVAEIYTSAMNVGEVLDLENKQALEEAIALNLVKVVEPEKQYIEKAVHLARGFGYLHKLSTADVNLIALALQLSEKKSGNIIVITDDYDIQNLLYLLGIPFKPLRTSGIKKPTIYKAWCPTCGYVPRNPGEDTCPLCNSKIVRKQANIPS